MILHQQRDSRSSVTEVLASEYMNTRKFRDASMLYQELLSKKNEEPILARRAMTSLVILLHRGLGDYESALKVHDQIAELYPHSRALVFAKVDLGLPLTEEEMKLMSDTTQLSKENSLTERNTQTNDVVTKEYVLYQSFPNPSNPSTTIRYEIPVDSKIHLAVYSSLGKVIATLVDREERQGVHLVEFDGSLLSSGTYMYRLRAEDLKSGEVKVLERKMMLLK